jgi:hypothetical protein
MKIFVAFGYNDRDRWVREMVFPIVQAFGDEVVTGEELQGEQITDAIRRDIQISDALIGFATRRGNPNNENRWMTHRWVTDEISHALAFQRLVAEIREIGVDDQGGIAGDRQRITYDESKRDQCLVEIVKTLGRWHQASVVKLQILPEACVEEIRPYLRHPNLRCTYKMLFMDGNQSEDIPTLILPITGGLFVHAKNVPRMALVQVHVECAGKSWTSNFENIDAVSVSLQQD